MVGQLVMSALTPVKGIGERAVKVATGGIFALGEMPNQLGVATLKQLQSQITYKGALKAIDKALACAVA